MGLMITDKTGERESVVPMSIFTYCLKVKKIVLRNKD